MSGKRERERKGMGAAQLVNRQKDGVRHRQSDNSTGLIEVKMNNEDR